LIAFLFLGTFCLCQRAYGQQELFPFVAEVTSKTVNIRAGQSKNFETLDKLKKGDLVIVLEHEFSWYKVKLHKTAKSYISNQFIQEVGEDKGIVIGNRVNIRGGASAS